MPDFASLTGETFFKVMVSNTDEPEKEPNPEVHLDNTKIRNDVVAQFIFLALLRSDNAFRISEIASDSLSQQFEFPEAADEYDHMWLDMESEKIREFLYYLESIGLAKVRDFGFEQKWLLTPTGRHIATRQSSIRALSK